MQFNEKLQKLRKEKGLSQEALAEMLDVSRQAISKWESGQSYPETDKLIVLSDIFGVTLDSFIKGGDLQNDGGNIVANPFWLTRGSVYEYKSRRKLLGLPLVHIHIGHGAKKAKGIVAVGNISQGYVSVGLIATGFVSLGLLSAGVIGLGVVSAGLLFAIGTLSIGTFSIGAVAIGIFTLGAVSIGVFSTGALAAASHIAVGDHAYGHIAVGRVAEGVRTFIDTSPARNFSAVNAMEVEKAILEEYPRMWNWIIKLMTRLLG